MATQRTLTPVWDFTATSSIKHAGQEQNDLRFVKTGSPVASHLGFQMSLFFNVWYTPFWIAISVYALCIKYDLLDAILAALCPVFVAFSILLEGCRLYFGYYGNLFENAAALGAFFLITIFLQIPLVVVQVASYRFRMLTVEWWMDIVLLAFILLETITGFSAYRQISLVHSRKLLLSSEYANFKRKSR